MAKGKTGFTNDGTGKRRSALGHVPLICMIVLLAAATGYLGRIAWLVDKNVDSFLQSSSSQTAKIIDERVNGEIARLDAMGHMLAETGEFTYAGYVSILRGQLKDYRRMGIFAPNGVLYSTAGDPRLISDIDSQIQSLLTLHSSSYGLLSPVFEDGDGERVILCAANLPAQGRVPGVLYGVITMDRFAANVLGDVREQRACITDQNGDIIYITESLRELTDDGADAQFRATLLSSARDNFSSQHWSGFRLTTAQLGFNGWVFTQLVPDEAIWDDEAHSLVIGIIVSLILLTAIIVITSYRILRRARGSENLVREVGTDRVTGINNHLGFITTAKQLLSRAGTQRYALVLMRTDVPEMFGARYDYDAGGHLLEDIARIINAECESGETCARLDGSQFLMMLRFSDTADTILRIKALNSHLLTQCPLRTHIHYGIYVVNDASAELGQMIECASEAALRVMRKGDLVGLYDDELHTQQLREEALLNRAQEALSKGEFEVRYRPLRDMTTLNTVGAEAVALWHQPDGTVLSPADYTPLLTRNSMMGPLNMYVLECVCHDLSAEARAGRTPGRILITLSHENLVDGMFVPRSQQLMKQYGIGGVRLEALVSEAIFAEEGALTGNVIQRLHDDGLRVCVSDFGHGATSMRIFGDLPVDAIRLSPAFIERSCDTERGRKLLSSLCDMAVSFGMSIYAGGELTHEQLKVLRECGCVRVERIDGDAPASRYCMLSEIQPDVSEKKDDPFGDWD